VKGILGRRVLVYGIKPEPGQIVTFLESDGGHVTRVLGRARGGRGTINFTASPGRRRRQIVAEITENRAPVQNMTVAAYTPPRLRRLARVRDLHVRRNGTNATVAFDAVSGANAYLVSLVMNDGARRLYRTTRHPSSFAACSSRSRAGSPHGPRGTTRRRSRGQRQERRCRPRFTTAGRGSPPPGDGEEDRHELTSGPHGG
jgi:hypothetical protein